MVKPFKSTYNTQGYPKIGPNIRFRIINDSLNGGICHRKFDHVKKMIFKLFEGRPCIHFFQRNGDFRVIYDFYRLIMIMLRSIDIYLLCVFGLFEVIKFRCSNTTDVRNFYIHDFHEFQEG